MAHYHIHQTQQKLFHSVASHSQCISDKCYHMYFFSAMEFDGVVNHHQQHTHGHFLMALGHTYCGISAHMASGNTGLFDIFHVK